MTGAALDRSRPAARSIRRCWPRSLYRARRARPESSGSPNLSSPAPAAKSAHERRRPSQACPAADADTSNNVRAANDANDESSPAARTNCPIAHEEASGPMRPGTPDRLHLQACHHRALLSDSGVTSPGRRCGAQGRARTQSTRPGSGWRRGRTPCSGDRPSLSRGCLPRAARSCRRRRRVCARPG
jgi:hypothetical protein